MHSGRTTGNKEGCLPLSSHRMNRIRTQRYMQRVQRTQLRHPLTVDNVYCHCQSCGRRSGYRGGLHSRTCTACGSRNVHRLSTPRVCWRCSHSDSPTRRLPEQAVPSRRDWHCSCRTARWARRRQPAPPAWSPRSSRPSVRRHIAGRHCCRLCYTTCWWRSKAPRCRPKIQCTTSVRRWADVDLLHSCCTTFARSSLDTDQPYM